ncbi:putative peptidase family M3 [Colletotrichum sublineola]|uniref:Putative peptidase family M3 n=1 Tax=Colletotrichum sublineola TaxID=1173701 RepID=A0A066XRK3_COLSU|nr:putative peptidase family M3 [Colletotrichum sublineola]
MDQEKIAEYFPLQHTVSHMLSIFKTLFGFVFHNKGGHQEHVWHDEVLLFSVWDDVEQGGGGFIGYLYLDLFPREGKTTGAANFNVVPGYTREDDSRQYPATALVCDVSRPTTESPSLLRHDEVVTLFHELGHAIHDLVANIKSGPSSTRTAICRILLRICILSQWILALGAAATKRWDAYLICFWIAFPIFCHAYLISPSLYPKSWSENQANIKVRRYSTTVSTCRSLLNTIIALNPDTFNLTADKKAIDYTSFKPGVMKWLDHILSESASREAWEQATREATPLALKELSSNPINSPSFSDPNSDFPGSAWNAKYRKFSVNRDAGEKNEANYWRRFVPEGIYIAAKIQKEAQIPQQETFQST